MFLDWIRKGKNKKTEVADAPKVDDPKPERESKTWKCSCGRKNNDYVSTCTCGTNKREMVYSATQQLDKAYIANSVEEKNDKIQWTIREDRQTTKISITSKGENTIRHYMGCDVLEDQVFEAVIAAGAQIIGIGMTEVHDWDDRDWYSAGFNSYEAYLQDAEHNRHICDWTAGAKYGGVSITISKPYNMVRDGLVFRYAGTDDTHLEEFFEMFDQHCCKKKTVIDRRDATQKQSCTGNNSKQKKTIEPKVASCTPVEERQGADPLNCKVSGDSPKRRENDAVNKQRKVFILHTAKTDEELALIQSELSALIKRECGKQIFPYMYDEAFVGHLGSFDYESVFYFFSLNGFEFTLSFGLDDKIITLTHKGRADDPFGNEFADRLKQYIHKVLTQKAVLEEAKAEFQQKCLDKCDDGKDYESQAKPQPKDIYTKDTVELISKSAPITDTHFLFSFIQPLEPSGLPFVENHVGIDVATGRPYRHSFFCTSPSFPSQPIASAPVTITFDELRKLALCELEECKAYIEKMEKENCANYAERSKKLAKKLACIVGTKESEWKTLLDL